MFVYKYNPLTREYVDRSVAVLNPLDPTLYLVPANSTLMPIPAYDSSTQSCRFIDGGWMVGKIVVSTTTTENGVPSGIWLLALAAENLAAGKYINLYTVDNQICVRLADSSVQDKPALGFVLDNSPAGKYIPVYNLNQTNTELSGLIQGSTYYLDPSNPGEVTMVLPVLPNRIQSLGIAISDTVLVYNTGAIPIALLSDLLGTPILGT